MAEKTTPKTGVVARWREKRQLRRERRRHGKADRMAEARDRNMGFHDRHGGAGSSGVWGPPGAP